MDERLIPKSIRSASIYICEQHPTLDVLWGTSEGRKAQYRERLRLSEEEFFMLTEWVEIYQESRELGFPQTFQTVELAKKFRERFFSYIELDIVELRLPVPYISDFLIESGEGESPERYGVERFILRHGIDKPSGRLLGHEVLGYENGMFHSYLCNGLETDYAEHFPFRLNEYGLIPTFEEAERYCAYSNQEEVETEDVLWLPWALYEMEP